MARFALCDRCGAVIRSSTVKQIGFTSTPCCMSVHDVCDECYYELKESMKIKEDRNNG